MTKEAPMGGAGTRGGENATVACARVSVRFVPTGVVTAKGAASLLGTLLLSPVTGTETGACVHEVEFENWPGGIEALVAASGGIQVFVAAVKPDEVPVPPATQGEAGVKAAGQRAHGNAVREAGEIARAVCLWRRAMGDALPGARSFSTLAGALGGTAPATKERDLVATGQGDAGLLLSLERSRSVLGRIADPRTNELRGAEPALGGPSRPAEALRTRNGDGLGPRRNNMPWLQGFDESDPRIKGKTEEIRAIEREKDRSARVDENPDVVARRDKARKQGEARQDYRTKRATTEELREQLLALGEHRTTGEPPSGALKTVAEATSDKTVALEGLLDRARMLHYAGTRADFPTHGTQEACKPDVTAAELALHRFFTVASQPKLARYFNLVIDVAVPLADRQWASLQGFPRVATVGEGERLAPRYVFVSARLGAAGDDRVVWTAAKLVLPDDGAAALFWPCTREEMDGRCVGMAPEELLREGLVAQIDGVLDLGAVADGQDGRRHPRFDLLTLDPRRAMEADIDADSQAAWRGGKETTVSTVPEGGLVLVDRWRQFHAASRAADRRAVPSAGPIVIDAEDLMVGIRLDVGLDQGRDYAWRSLVERRIAFGDKEIEQSVALLVPDAGQRAALDAAPLTVATRVRLNTTAGGGTSAFTEEILAQWLGEPLGVDLHAAGVGRRAADLDHHDPESCAVNNLVDIDMGYSLPAEGSERPPRQCFGWAVRVGARVQLEGGLSRPLRDVRPLYEAATGHSLSLPPSGAGVRGRRLLRHRRIEAPVVTTPLEILQRPVRGPQETAMDLVIRSTAGEKGGLVALGPEATHRVLVPPAISLEFADRHDVFEPKQETLETGPGGAIRPKGGLVAVAYDRKAFGTFPVWSTQETSDGKTYPDWPAPKPGQELDLKKQPFPAPTGDAVFMPVELGVRPSNRPLPYYPDPAAEFMVFRLRKVGGGDVPGQSLVVRVRRKGVSYPEVTPIAVQVVRLATLAPLDQGRLGLDCGPNAVPATGHEAWQQAAAPAYLDASAAIGKTPGGRWVEGTRVVARLAPGEQLELDVWCLPRWETLLALFDVVEAAALVVQARGGSPDACLSEPAFIRTLAMTVGWDENEVRRLMTAVEHGSGNAPAGPCGPGQLPLPCANHLCTIAAVIQQAARDVVMPELAARTTLRLTHAISQPLQPPSFDLPKADPSGLGQGGITAFPVLLSRRQEPDGKGVGGTDRVEFAGSIAVDRATSRFVEVRARGAYLVSGAFDDPRRGRSDDDQARGVWPSTGLVEGGWRTPGELFGFDVLSNGIVRLRMEETTLLRIDDIAAQWKGGDLIDLGAVEETLRAQEADTMRAAAQAAGLAMDEHAPRKQLTLLDGSHPTRPHTIDDAKARVLELQLVAGSRTAQLIRQPDGSALSAKEQSATSSGWYRVLLPASKAPARVVPSMIRPAFQIIYEGLSATRTVRLRVRARRTWYSSGTGERLGIVLWPPDFAARAGVGDTDQVERDYLTAVGEPSRMDMEAFSDLDLGLGGEFVTRWGGDPAAGGPAPVSWLMPPSCFAQAKFGSTKPWSPEMRGADDDEVVYVPRAIMPLPLPPGGIPGSSEGPSTMAVALLAFRPRFDVDLEHFYFDVEIDPGRALEPFVRLGLVRYQANAPAGLRVSEPVVEWAQLLPKRVLEASIRAESDGLFQVDATVTGQARHGSSMPHAEGELGARMCFGVYRVDAAGRQSLVAQSSAMAGQGTAAWTSPPDHLRVDENPAHPAEAGVRYFLLASEQNEMLPASYEAEPFDPKRAGARTEPAQSGPRFAAWLPLASGSQGRSAANLSSSDSLSVHYPP